MKTITTVLKYAFPYNYVLLPNLDFQAQNEEGETVTTYKSRLTISYDILDENRQVVNIPIEERTKHHYSDASEVMLTQEEIAQWDFDNRLAFVAADKLELINFTGE